MRHIGTDEVLQLEVFSPTFLFYKFVEDIFHSSRMSTCPYAAVAAARNAKCGVRIAFTVCGVEDLELSVRVSDTTILTLPPSLGIEMDAAIRSGTKTLAELLESVYDAISPSLSQMAVGVGMLQQFRAQCLFEGGGQPSKIQVRMPFHLAPPPIR